MKENWPATAEFLKKFEGPEFTRDPDDLGGASKWGIDARSHPSWSVEAIKNLTWTDAAGIHKADTWDKLRCDELPAPLDMIVCDTAVLCGNDIAAKWLQVAVGVIPDGKIGDRTIRAAALAPSYAGARMIDFRQHYHETVCDLNPAQEKFKKGWINRVNDLAVASSQL